MEDKPITSEDWKKAFKHARETPNPVLKEIMDKFPEMQRYRLITVKVPLGLFKSEDKDK